MSIGRYRIVDADEYAARSQRLLNERMDEMVKEREEDLLDAAYLRFARLRADGLDERAAFKRAIRDAAEGKL